MNENYKSARIYHLFHVQNKIRETEAVILRDTDN